MYYLRRIDSLFNYFIGRLSNFLCNEVTNKIPSHTLRIFLYRNFFHVKIGNNSSIGMHTVLNSANKIWVGNNCAIGQYVHLDGRGELIIGNNVNIAGRTSIYTATHNQYSPKWEYIESKVTIKDDVWVASNAVIIQGITINRGAVVAAGAVVVKSVDEFDIVGGNPAKKIGERPKNIEYITHYFPLFY